MFKRKKVQPFIDEYILRHYDDIAVRINADIRNGRGLRNYYAPWLEGMLQGFPETQRNKYSLLTPKPRPVLNAWAEKPGSHTESGGPTRSSASEESESAELNGHTTGDHSNIIPTRNTHEITVNTNSKFCVIL